MNCSWWYKLSAMLVFKGQPDGKVERRLHKKFDWLKIKSICLLSTKGMKQSDDNEKWINEVWRKYSHFVVKKDTILVMDDASMHKIDIVNDKIKVSKTNISMISGGLKRRYLQLWIYVH